MRTIDEHIKAEQRADALMAGCHGRDLCEASERHRRQLIDELTASEARLSTLQNTIRELNDEN